jgi:uncharacterized membrane protein YraQ (UPF0718 family)
MKNIIKKYWFIVAVVIANLLVLIFNPKIEINVLNFTWKNFLNFLFMLTPIFICIGLIDVWIERETMIKIMGKKSGFKGILIALLLGVITAVPLYALLPVAGVLLKKCSRVSNILIFLCSSASIRIPLLLFEISSLGWRFTFVRFLLNIVVVFVIAFVIEKILTEEDKKAIYENIDKI